MPSPALRGAGKNCTISKRLPKVLRQSDQTKLQLKACLLPSHQPTARCCLLAHRSTPQTSHFRMKSNQCPYIKSSSDQQLALQPSSPGVMSSKDPAQSLAFHKQISNSSIPICPRVLAMPSPFHHPQCHITVPLYTQN